MLHKVQAPAKSGAPLGMAGACFQGCLLSACIPVTKRAGVICKIARETTWKQKKKMESSPDCKGKIVCVGLAAPDVVVHHPHLVLGLVFTWVLLFSLTVTTIVATHLQQVSGRG